MPALCSELGCYCDKRDINRNILHQHNRVDGVHVKHGRVVRHRFVDLGGIDTTGMSISVCKLELQIYHTTISILDHYPLLLKHDTTASLHDELRHDISLTYLFISHDLSVVEHLSDRIAVMYLGKIAEIGTSDQIISQPSYPYTLALLKSVPRVGVKEIPIMCRYGTTSRVQSSH